MKESGKFELIFADVQQDPPQYLCMDESGFYLCTVRQQDGGFIEQQARVDVNGAMIFIAKTFNKAMIKTENIRQSQEKITRQQARNKPPELKA